MKINDASEFGKAIRKRRKELNYTQRDLSEFTGFSISYLSELMKMMMNFLLKYPAIRFMLGIFPGTVPGILFLHMLRNMFNLRTQDRFQSAFHYSWRAFLK